MTLTPEDITSFQYKTDDGQVQILRESLFSLQVCAPADMPRAEVVSRVNAMHLCGTTNGWTMKADEDEQDNCKPVACGDNAHRIHYILWA